MADMMTSVELVEFTLTGNTGSVNLSKGQNYENCVPYMTLHGGQDYQDCHCVDVYFSGTTQSGVVNFQRSVNRSTNMYIKCYVVEYDPNEVTVHQGSLPSNVTTTTANNVVSIPGGFTQNNSFMIFNWRSSSGTQLWRTHCVRGRVNGDDTVDFYRANGDGTVTGHFFLVESINNHFTVHHQTSTFTGTSTEIKTRYRFNMRQFLVSSYATDVANAYNNRGTIRSYFAGNGFAYMDRNYAQYTIHWYNQTVKFTDESKIFSYCEYPFSFASATGSQNLASSGKIFADDGLGTDLAWDPDEVCVFSAMPHGKARHEYAGGTYMRDCWTSLTSTASGVLNFARNNGSSSYTSYMSVTNVINWNGKTIASGINTEPLDPERTCVKSVQNGQIKIDHWFSGVRLTKGQDLNNCVVFHSHYTDGTTDNTPGNNYLAEVWVDSPNMLLARRSTSRGNLYVNYSVVEFYPDQVDVQSGWEATSGTEMNFTISGVDTSKTFLTASWQVYSGADRWDTCLIRARLSSSTGVNTHRVQSDGMYSASWYTAEDKGDFYRVEHNLKTFSKTTRHISDNDHHYPYYNSFVINSHSGGHSGLYPDRSLVRSYYVDTHYPAYMECHYDSYNKYANLQTIRIIKSNRRYTWTPGKTFASSGGEYSYTGTMSAIVSTAPEASSFHNNNLSSCGEVEGSSSNNNAAGCYAGLVPDFDTGTYDIITGTSLNVAQRFYFTGINWLGYDEPTVHTPSVKTRSLVNSIEVFDYDSTVDGGLGSIKYHKLTKGQNGNQCVPFMTWSAQNDDGYMDRIFVNAYIYGGDDDDPYLFRKLASTGQSLATSIYVVEFDENQVKIQKGSCRFNGGTSVDVTIEEVDTERAFLIFYSNNHTWTRTYRDALIAGRILDSNTLRFERANSSGYVMVGYYVVECLDEQWQVFHATKDANESDQYTYINWAYKFNQGSCLVTASYSHTCNNSYPDRAHYRAVLRGDSEIQLDRNYSSYNIRRVNASAIEFNHKLGVRSAYEYSTIADTSTSTSPSYSLRPNFDPNRTIVNNIMLSNTSRTNGGDSDSDHGFAKMDLSGTTNVEVSKKITGHITYSYPQLVEFPDYNKYYVSGTVVEDDFFPVQRTVRMYRSDTGELMDEVVSVSGTGEFYAETTYSGAHYVVCLDDAGLPDYNDLIYGKIYPTVISGCFAYNEGLV